MPYEQLLALVAMFRQLSKEDLIHLSGLLQKKTYAKGEVIFHQGDVGRALFIIRAGEVAIRLSSPDGQEVILTLLGRGCAFGELSLLDGMPRSADAVAREQTQVLILQQEDFHRFLNDRPPVALSMLAQMAATIRRITRQVHDTAFLDTHERLARVLLDLALTQGKPHSEGHVLLPTITQTDLAKLCGMTRESTNRCLRTYCLEKVITYERRKIVILDLERLRRDVE